MRWWSLLSTKLGLADNPREKFEVVENHAFYAGKSLIKVEWWISYCCTFPRLYWARLRVFSDGSADAAFDEMNVYGFESRVYASYFLAEDEYKQFDHLDQEDEIDIGAKKSEMVVPEWEEPPDARFKYLGTY